MDFVFGNFKVMQYTPKISLCPAWLVNTHSMVWVSTQSSLDEKLSSSLLVKMLPVALGQAQVMRKPAKTLWIINSEYWVLVYTQTDPYDLGQVT